MDATPRELVVQYLVGAYMAVVTLTWSKGAATRDRCYVSALGDWASRTYVDLLGVMWPRRAKKAEIIPDDV